MRIFLPILLLLALLGAWKCRRHEAVSVVMVESLPSDFAPVYAHYTAGTIANEINTKEPVFWRKNKAFIAGYSREVPNMVRIFSYGSTPSEAVAENQSTLNHLSQFKATETNHGHYLQALRNRLQKLKKENAPDIVLESLSGEIQIVEAGSDLTMERTRVLTPPEYSGLVPDMGSLITAALIVGAFTLVYVPRRN